jgi:hypothetical protein
MDFSHVAVLMALALFASAGLHYDLLRTRTAAAAGAGGDPAWLHAGRILIAGLLISAATVTVLCLVSLIYPEFSFDFGGFTENAESPGLALWTALCFTFLALTVSALSATVMTYLEFHPRYAPNRPWTQTPQTLRRMARNSEDIEVEVKLADGTTYRGLLGGHEQPDRYLVLTEPIFDVGDHGKPLPMDALNWPWLAVPQSRIISLLARPIQDGLAERRTQPTSLGPRHSNPHFGLVGQLKLFLQSCYQRRFDPYTLAKVLCAQVGFMTLLAVLARSFATLV